MLKDLTHPVWSYSSNIYEVNVRQYTPEGTFRAFASHLPRLKDMGVEILWFMPITPISEKDRKGTLGSYYAVQDYTSINPEFGNLFDFKELVHNAHEMGFKVIIDWVANHAGNDNVWIAEHPDYFVYDEYNNILHPNGWDDVSKLNFDNYEMRRSMIESMRFWITDSNIDGFRCDMAHLVPLDFWVSARRELNNTRQGLFWLAECEEVNYHDVFDATYTWKWMHKTEAFCRKEFDLNGLLSQLYEYDNTFPANAFRVYFTSNHDENSWNGTEYEKYGQAALLLAIFSCTWKGIPMLYSGQELPNMKRLNFFDKDVIEWGNGVSLHDFYKRMLHLKKSNSALRSSDDFANTTILPTLNGQVFSYTRTYGTAEVAVFLNFSDYPAEASLVTLSGTYTNVFSGDTVDSDTRNSCQLGGWEYLVLEKESSLI